MNNNPLISIIVPVYKVEQYLDKCIDSIIAQDYRNIELILVDDGSPDRCPEICDNRAASNSQIKVTHIPNSGQAAVRNVGLNIANGELVMFVDSDDFWSTADTSTLTRLVNRFYAGGNSMDFLIFNYYHYYQNDNVVRPNRPYPDIQGNGNDIDSMLNWFSNTGHYPMMAWGKLIRKDFLINNNIQFIAGIQSEDIPWFAEMLVKSKCFGICNEYFYIYRRQVRSSITSGFSFKKIDDIILVIQKLYDLAVGIEDNPILRSTLLSFAAYEYVVALHLCTHMDKKSKLKYTEWFKDNKKLLTYAKSRKERIAAVCLNLLGYNLTAKLLNQYVKRVVTK